MKNFVINTTSTDTTYDFDVWSDPIRMDVNVKDESIEIIYKQFSRLSQTGLCSTTQPSERVYKIIYNCVNGKWNQTGKIFGRILPAREERYIFEDQNKENHE